MTTGVAVTNYMRQYYDVYSLLADRAIQDFVGTEEYCQHKKLRFSDEDFDLPIYKNEAFFLSDPWVREKLQKRYELTKTLYYKGQPAFDDILKRILEFVNKL